MISLNLFQHLPTMQYSIIVDQSEDNVLCNSYLNDICVHYTEKISKHCNSYCSVRCILRMPELKKFFLLFFFHNGKYLLTFITFNRFMKKNKPNFLIEIEQNEMNKWNLQAILVCILKSDLSIKERLRQKRYYFPIKKGFREVYLHALHDSG